MFRSFGIVDELVWIASSFAFRGGAPWELKPVPTRFRPHPTLGGPPEVVAECDRNGGAINRHPFHAAGNRCLGVSLRDCYIEEFGHTYLTASVQVFPGVIEEELHDYNMVYIAGYC